jgi:hypothetical protein
MKRINCIITITIDGITHYVSKDITLTTNRDDAIVFNGRNRAKRVLLGIRRLGVQGAHIRAI